MDWDTIWEVAGRGAGILVGSSAVAAVAVAAGRGISGLVLERGPRRRVEAIKKAQETLPLLDAASVSSVYIAMHRDDELRALARVMERRRVAAQRWNRFTQKGLPATFVVFAILTLLVVLYAPMLREGYSVLEASSVLVPAFAGVALALGFMVLRRRGMQEAERQATARRLADFGFSDDRAAREAERLWDPRR